MSNAEYVQEAKDWSDYLLKREFRGAGDTIDAAMHRASKRHGVSHRTFWSLRYRPPKGLLTEVYLKLRAAYASECARQQRLMMHEIEIAKATENNAASQALIRAAARVAGIDREEG